MKTKKYAFTLAVLLPFTLGGLALGAVTSGDRGIYLLPLNCSELLPDPMPFSSFFEAVARSSAKHDPKFSRRVFRVLALRDKLSQLNLKTRDQNPVDTLIRKTLCFFREQREPMRAITVDDEKFITFLKSGLHDLEKKVEDTVFQAEFERQQRYEYERRVRDNQAVIDRIQRQADREAGREFELLSKRARRKVKTQ